MNSDNIVFDNEQGSGNNEQLNYSKFKNLGKEKFQSYINFEVDPTIFIKNIANQASFNLPQQLDDYYFDEETYPYLWVSDHPLIKRTEQNFFSAVRGKSITTAEYEDIKKYFSKWLLQSQEKEKQYFALSTVNLIQRNTNNQNFFKYLLLAIIFTYDAKMFFPEKAAENLTKAMEIISTSKLSAEVKNTFIYFINMHFGYLFNKQADFATANQSFNNALQHKENGIAGLLETTKFEAMAGNGMKVQENISKLIQMDCDRIEYAIANRSILLFEFILRNAFTYNLFKHREFSGLIAEIEFLLSSHYAQDPSILEHIYDNIALLGRVDIAEYMTPEIEEQLQFLTDFILKFRENRNSLLLIAGKILKDNFNQLISNLIQSINQDQTDMINAKLKLFDNQINEKSKEFNGLKEGVDMEKQILENKTNKLIDDTEIAYNENIRILEEKLDNIEINSNYDPGTAFSNSMGYNVMISLIISVIGGFGGAFIQQVDSSNFVAQVLLDGVKWGGITFILGIIASLFSAGSVLSERSRAKSSLIKKLKFLKKAKEQEIESIKKLAADKEKMIEAQYNVNYHELEEEINKLKKEKEDKFRELKEIHYQSIAKEINRLKNLFISYSDV